MTELNADPDIYARDLLNRVFDAAVLSARSTTALADHLPSKPAGRCIVVGAGKASAAMAAALEAAWPDVPMQGAVVVPDGYSTPTRAIAVIEASHPVPDARSEAAARRMLDLVSGLQSDDLVIALISGGGSSVMALPATGLTLADKIQINRALLSCGATIRDMNRVRGALSAVKAGRLARAAAPARLVTLVVSDVPGDKPEEIASGPTVGTPPTRAEARAILGRYGIEVSPAVKALLAAPDEPSTAMHTVEVSLVATPLMALEAAAEVARADGIETIILGDAIEGEAREVAVVMAGIARSVATRSHPAAAPLLLLSGGETTVTLGKGAHGKGGRNTEFLLSLAVALAGEPRIWALAGDTDGIDGSQDAAGALIGPGTIARAIARGIDCRAALDAHDSYSAFAALGDLVLTGPTCTNVNDFRAILIA